MFVSVKYIHEQSGTTTILGNEIVMGHKICMVMERLIPHSNVTDIIRLTKIRLWTTKGEQKDSKSVPFTQENFVGENTCPCPCSINIGRYIIVIYQF